MMFNQGSRRGRRKVMWRNVAFGPRWMRVFGLAGTQSFDLGRRAFSFSSSWIWAARWQRCIGAQAGGQVGISTGGPEIFYQPVAAMQRDLSASYGLRPLLTILSLSSMTRCAPLMEAVAWSGSSCFKITSSLRLRAGRKSWDWNAADGAVPHHAGTTVDAGNGVKVEMPLH